MQRAIDFVGTVLMSEIVDSGDGARMGHFGNAIDYDAGRIAAARRQEGSHATTAKLARRQ
jgi:hypothetical protein